MQSRLVCYSLISTDIFLQFDNILIAVSLVHQLICSFLHQELLIFYLQFPLTIFYSLHFLLSIPLLPFLILAVPLKQHIQVINHLVRQV